VSVSVAVARLAVRQSLCGIFELIVDLVASGDEREQQRLDYWLTRWANDLKQPCTPAANIRSNMPSGTYAKETHA
jgi:hypothetical protein